MKTLFRRGWLMALLAFPFSPSVSAGAASSERRPIAAVKASAPPVVDGDLTDKCWLDAPKAETFFDRQRGSRAPDPTIVRLLYDDRYIYVAFDCKDSMPDRIVARETVRDHKYQNEDESDNEDNVEVILDPYRSYKYDDFALFSVNPLGTRSARITGGRANKAEWKGDWDAAARRLSDGWTAEMRIPWAILNYPSSRQPLTMGINFTRRQERTRTQYIWSNIGPQYYNELEGQWTGVEVPAAAFRPRLSLMPYLMPGPRGSSMLLRSGMDARYTLTPQLTFVASVNPDFATIEGAVESISFSRSEQFVPERRPFFLEGGDYFNTGLGGPLFYSNRIQTFDVGTKLYGKLTPSDTLGVLHTLDYGNRSTLVCRYRHDLSATSDFSLFLTNLTAKDDDNTVAQARQGARWGKLGLETKWAASLGRDAGGDAKQLNLTYGDKHNFTYCGYQDISPRFRDANGLIFFNDNRGFEFYHEWGANWKQGVWRDFHVGLYSQYNWHADGRPFQRGFHYEMFFATRSDWGVALNAGRSRFDDQTDETYGMFFGCGLSNRFRKWGIGFGTGRLANRPVSSIGPSFSFRVLKRLDIAYGGNVQNYEGRAQQHVVTLNYEMSPTRSFGGRIVTQNASTNWYLSYRHAGERGTEVYFILGDPNAPRFARQALVKLVFAM